MCDADVRVIVQCVNYAQTLLALPDECLVESLDALRTARSETEPRALSTLASIRDSLLILLDAVDRARDRVLAAGAKTNGAKLN